MKKIIAIAVLGLCLGSPAWACEFVERPFEESLAAAQVAFIGKIIKQGDDKFYFAVYQGLKGIETTEFVLPFKAESTCDISFREGQVWLYLGPTQPAGSMLIADYLEVYEPAATFVRDRFQYELPKY